MSDFGTLHQFAQHTAWLEAKCPVTANDGLSALNGEFKHPGRAPCFHDPIFHHRRPSPTAPSESDKSSPPEIFSPASSAISSSATSVSSASTCGNGSPPPSSACWATSTVAAPGPECFLQRSFPQVCQDLATTNKQPKSNPRRTAVSSSWIRPSLVRQEQRRQHLVEQLVDSATQLVARIWPASNAPTSFPNKIISLRFYIRETLRRSRTSYSTLQVTLWYLVLIQPYVAAVTPADINSSDPSDEQSGNSQEQRTKADGPSCPLQCGRRMFLSALILASKYLQDRNFTARAWSKITGLPSKEIVSNEFMFLSKISWSLHLKEQDFKHWNAIILSCVGPTRFGQNLHDTWSRVLDWVQEGLSVQVIAGKLSAQRQAPCLNSDLSTYDQLSTLFTPNSSFNCPSGPSFIHNHSPSSGVCAKASPAISVASDSSASSSFSCTEVKVPAMKFDEPIVAKSGNTIHTKRVAGQLLTPSASFDFGRCDNDGRVAYPSQASTLKAPTEGIKTLNPQSLVNPYGSPSSVASSQCSLESDNGMRASAQQPSSMPYRPMENAASWLDSSTCALPQRSIAHAAIKQPRAACGLKRAATDDSVATLTTLNDFEPNHRAKYHCGNGLQPLQISRLAS